MSEKVKQFLVSVIDNDALQPIERYLKCAENIKQITVTEYKPEMSAKSFMEWLKLNHDCYNCVLEEFCKFIECDCCTNEIIKRIDQLITRAEGV